MVAIIISICFYLFNTTGTSVMYISIYIPLNSSYYCVYYIVALEYALGR